MDILTILCIIFLLLLLALPFIAVIESKKQKKKLMNLYNKIKIGDNFNCRINIMTDNPFNDDHYDYVITITDKSLNKNGIPYVKYKYQDGSEGSDKLEEILMYII